MIRSLRVLCTQPKWTRGDTTHCEIRHTVMAYIVMAYIAMFCIVMVERHHSLPDQAHV